MDDNFAAFAPPSSKLKKAIKFFEDVPTLAANDDQDANSPVAEAFGFEEGFRHELDELGSNSDDGAGLQMEFPPRPGPARGQRRVQLGGMDSDDGPMEQLQDPPQAKKAVVPRLDLGGLEKEGAGPKSHTARSRRLRIGKLLSVDVAKNVDGVVGGAASPFTPQQPHTSEALKFLHLSQKVSREAEDLETLIAAIDRMRAGIQRTLRSQAALQALEGAKETDSLLQTLTSTIREVFDQDIISQLSEQVFNKQKLYEATNTLSRQEAEIAGMQRELQQLRKFKERYGISPLGLGQRGSPGLYQSQRQDSGGLYISGHELDDDIIKQDEVEPRGGGDLHVNSRGGRDTSESDGRGSNQRPGLHIDSPGDDVAIYDHEGRSRDAVPEFGLAPKRAGPTHLKTARNPGRFHSQAIFEFAGAEEGLEELAHLRKENSDLKAKIETLDQNIEKKQQRHNAKIHDLQAFLDTKEAKIEKLQAKNMQLDQRVKADQARIEQLNYKIKEVMTSQKQSDKWNKNADDLNERQREQIQQLQDLNSKQSKLADQLQSRVLRMSQEKEQLQKRIDTLKRKNQQDASVIDNFAVIQEQLLNKNKADKVSVTRETLLEAIEQSKRDAKTKWKDQLLSGDKADQALLSGLSPDVAKAVVAKMDDVRVRRKVLEETLGSMRLVIDAADHPSKRVTAKVNIYFHDVVRSRARLIAEDVIIYKITNPQFQMMQQDDEAGKREIMNPKYEEFGPIVDPSELNAYSPYDGSMRRGLSLQLDNSFTPNSALAGAVRPAAAEGAAFSQISQNLDLSQIQEYEPGPGRAHAPSLVSNDGFLDRPYIEQQSFDQDWDQSRRYGDRRNLEIDAELGLEDEAGRPLETPLFQAGGAHPTDELRAVTPEIVFSGAELSLEQGRHPKGAELPELMDEAMSHNMSKQDAVMSALGDSFCKNSKDVGVQTESMTPQPSRRDLNLQTAQRKSCFFGCRR